ncbi:MAG: tRNA 2-selenouridine(34) synthase MnmH, partial [Limnohabitans sp.]
PGALNWPSLTNEERIRVGTLYKQVGPFEANKVGAMLVAANIAKHIERSVLRLPKDWQPLLYCWRGGKRSGSLALVLGQIGFRVWLIDGGYKAFRAAMLQDIAQLVTGLRFHIITGSTGSGKTRLLHALTACGAQVLDLEDLARHRSSVLGRIPGVPQPSQKHFDTLVWDKLRQFDPQKPVFVEAESKKVGNVAVPQALMDAMRQSPCIDLQLSDDERVKLLLEDYAFFANDQDLFAQRLDLLTELKGKAVVNAWRAQLKNAELEPVVRDLLLNHYDPTYAKSVARNFVQYANASIVRLENRHSTSMKNLATQLQNQFGQ